MAVSSRRLLSVLAVVGLVVLAGCTVALDPSATPSSDPTSESPLTTPSSSAYGNGSLSVHYLNVGQASSTLIVGPDGDTILIDTGDWSADGEGVLSYLKTQNITRIDYLVTSHADADHIGGHEAVINYYETQARGVGAIYDPGLAASSETYQEYLDAVETYDVPLYEARAGDTIPVEGFNATILAPPKGYLADEDRNENSLVLHLRYGNTTFLLPGDGEQASEQYLREAYGRGLNVTVFAVGHHGSRSSTSTGFLDATTPRVSVISSAYDSQYGHPHEEVLTRLATHEIRTYWTATHGTIRITTNGSQLSVATQATAPTDPLRLREGDPISPDDSTPLRVRTTLYANGTTALTDGGTTTTTTTSDSDSGSESGVEALALTRVHADASGDESANLNDEYLVFENTASESIDLGGLVVSDAAGHTYTFPSGFTLAGNTEVTLHTGSGTDSRSGLYWGAESAIWNNNGDTVTVETPSGTIIIEETYE